MRFADYLSRHTNSPPTGKNMNENHVISTLTAVQYRLHTTHNKLTNHKARNTNTLNDVKIRSSWNDRKKPLLAFCHLHISRQSLCSLHRQFKQ